MNEVQDLCNLIQDGELKAETAASVLRANFLSESTYTRLSPFALVSINPNKLIQLNTDNGVNAYVSEQWEPSEELPPHVWQMAAKSYFYMRRTGQDQSIVLRGSVGSGKTEVRRLLVSALIHTAPSAQSKKEGKLVKQIPASQFIMHSFGHASTLANANASRYGSYTEIQYGEGHRLCGIKSLPYHLDISRLAKLGKGERNFHVFHYLLAGATAEEADHLKLNTPFRYLSGAGYPSNVHDDASKADKLKEALKLVSFSKRAVASIYRVLAAILHLGQLDFFIDKSRNEDSASVLNYDVLVHIASLLGVTPEDLESALNTQTKLYPWKERVSFLLDAEGASMARDDLASTLYGLLFAWISEYLNSKLSKDDFKSFVSILDFPGTQASSSSSRSNGLDELCFNLANERLQSFLLERTFESQKAEYENEQVSSFLPGLSASYFSNPDGVRILTAQPGGLVHIVDDQSARRGKSDSTMLASMGKRWGANPSFGWRAGDETLGRTGTFVVNHYDAQVTYSTEGFLEANRATVSSNFVQLFAAAPPSASGLGVGSNKGSTDALIQELFSSEAAKVKGSETGGNEKLKLRATLRVKPSMRRKGDGKGGHAPSSPQDEALPADSPDFILGSLNSSLTVLLEALAETRLWIVACLKPNEAGLPIQADAKCLRSQIGALGLTEIARRLDGVWAVDLLHREFWDRYHKLQSLQPAVAQAVNAIWADKLKIIASEKGWADRGMVVGKYKVFLTHEAFKALEDELRSEDEQEMETAREKGRIDLDSYGTPVYQDPFSPYAPAGSAASHSQMHEQALSSVDFGMSSATLPLVGHEAHMAMGTPTPFEDDDTKSYFGGRHDDAASTLYAPSAYMFSNEKGGMANEKVYQAPETKAVDTSETVETVRQTTSRRLWVILTWMMTWWIPGFVISQVGRMKRKDVQMAWREKLTINMLIWLLCGSAIFVIVFLGDLLCPKQHVYTLSELQDHGFNNRESNLVAIRGEVFDITEFSKIHSPAVISSRSVLKYAGTDASALFPVQISALCNGVDGNISPFLSFDSLNGSEKNAIYHDFRYSTTLEDPRPDWYMEQMIYMRYKYRRGFMGYTAADVSKMASVANTRNVVIYEDGIYDMTQYISNNGGVAASPNGTNPPTNIERTFMHPSVVNLFVNSAGSDITSALNNLNMEADVLTSQQTCLRNLFFRGHTDTRNSPQCQFSRYILLALSIVMITIIGFKFFAALNFSRSRTPEDAQKFVILQVPAYTEGEASLRRCLESLAATKYDDKRKLIFVLCDGNIVGAGNEKSTPRIVLDILGSQSMIDPEPLSFESLGEGSKQHNMGQVYSGLYEHAGHVVPYIVVVKCGRAHLEKSKPGNRGKRDSQMLVMRWLNRVAYNSPMSPLELELYHQVKNVIGVQPSYYEFLLSVDADTQCDRDSLNRMINAMIRDRRIVGLCGETSLSNGRHSFVTMLQVFEYFISHHLSKAFESLFGSVTCLPGCFSLFRIKTVDQKPLLCSNQLIDDFGINLVDTLHLKNLLHLGEDRYLTTLLLKHFPTHKTVFVRDASAKTIAPDEWKVLLSQRRRWINSTVHNLVTLLSTDRLCGFCFFSMRFMVFVDLLSTIIAPVQTVYIAYLIYLVAAKGQTVPTTALIMIAAIYGLQAIIFILHGAFEMVGWLVIYVLAIPIFSLLIPVYSFWKMDDFSWGNTRMIAGERGRRFVVHEEGTFDPSEIPRRTWQDFESDLWEQGSNQSIGSIIAHGKRAGQGDSDSIYGKASQLGLDRLASPQQSPGIRSTMLYDLDTPAGSPGARNSLQGGYFQSASTSPRTSRQHTPLPSVTLSDLQQIYLNEGPRDRARQVGIPDDERLSQDVYDIVRAADLTIMSKRSVREELQSLYGVNSLGEKTAFVNRLIEEAALSLQE